MSSGLVLWVYILTAAAVDRAEQGCIALELVPSGHAVPSYGGSWPALCEVFWLWTSVCVGGWRLPVMTGLSIVLSYSIELSCGCTVATLV